MCFTKAFAQSPAKAAQWSAFLRNSRLADGPAGFADVVDTIVAFAGPVMEAVVMQRDFALRWRHPGPWAAN